MESLVEKWKTTINSKNFSNSFRESQNMAKNNSLQSSNEKPPIKPSVGLPSSIRKNLRAVSSTSSDDDLSLELFRQPAEKKKQPKLNSAKKTKVLNENTPVKSITKDFIKENVYLVLDLFEKEIPLKERITNIKKILENVYEEGKKINLELNSEKLTETTVGKLSESKKAFKTKIEDSSKMLSELEARLFQSEKEKVQLKSEKERFIKKLEKLDDQLKQKKINYELIERLQENNKTIEKNNLSLLQELETANKRLHDQQKIFENQVGELNQMFEKIKNQNSYE